MNKYKLKIIKIPSTQLAEIPESTDALLCYGCGVNFDTLHDYVSEMLCINCCEKEFTATTTQGHTK